MKLHYILNKVFKYGIPIPLRVIKDNWVMNHIRDNNLYNVYIYTIPFSTLYITAAVSVQMYYLQYILLEKYNSSLTLK